MCNPFCGPEEPFQDPSTLCTAYADNSGTLNSGCYSLVVGRENIRDSQFNALSAASSKNKISVHRWYNCIALCDATRRANYQAPGLLTGECLLRNRQEACSWSQSSQPGGSSACREGGCGEGSGVQSGASLKTGAKWLRCRCKLPGHNAQSCPRLDDSISCS